MKITRRNFIKKSLAAYFSLLGLSSLRLPKQIMANETFDLLVITGSSPKARITKMFEAFGGAKNLITPNSFIALKPNASFARTPKQAANINPETIFTLTDIIKKETSPKTIKAFDYTSDPADISFEKSGIREALKNVGEDIYAAESQKMYEYVNIPKARELKQQLVNKDIAKSDFFINIAVPKHHNITSLTMGIKNLMGCIFNRDIYHMKDLNRCIAELATAIKPDLNIIDAENILLTRGPHGPGKVKHTQTTIISKDILLADAYAATLFKQKAQDIPHLKHAYELGVGEIDLSKAKIKTINL